MRYSHARVEESPHIPVTYPPPRHGGTDWRGVSLVLGAIGVIGSSVIVPIVLRQPVADVSSLATKADVETLKEKVDALARSVGAARDAGEGASSQLKGVLERVDAIEKAKPRGRK